MRRDLARGLHTLHTRLIRAADRMLRAEGVPYRRFLALYLVHLLGTPTQRELADALGVTEPSVSRMAGVLAGEGLLEVRPDPAGGNRRRLRLTDEGTRLMLRCGALLEDQLAALLASSGVPYDSYADHTNRLLAALEAAEGADRPSSGGIS